MYCFNCQECKSQKSERKLRSFSLSGIETTNTVITGEKFGREIFETFGLDRTTEEQKTDNSYSFIITDSNNDFARIDIGGVLLVNFPYVTKSPITKCLIMHLISYSGTPFSSFTIFFFFIDAQSSQIKMSLPPLYKAHSRCLVPLSIETQQIREGYL
jgi:hypothetical protein